MGRRINRRTFVRGIGATGAVVSAPSLAVTAHGQTDVTPEGHASSAAGTTSSGVSRRWEHLLLKSVWEKEQNLPAGDGSQAPRCMEFSPKNNYSTVFMGIDTAGVYRSDDGGLSWSSKHDGILVEFVKSIAIDPVNPDVVYALASGRTGEKNLGRQSVGTGLYLSEDNGETWQLQFPLELWFPPENSHSIAIAPDSFDARIGRCATVLVGGSDGMYRSDDGAVTFDKIDVPEIEGRWITSVFFHRRDPNRVVLAGEVGVFVSDDGGHTYHGASDGLPEGEPVLAVALHPRARHLMYAITAGDAYRWRGRDWRVMETGLPTDRGSHYEIRTHPAAPSTVVIGYARRGPVTPRFSEDGGDSWETRNTLVDADHRFAIESHRRGEKRSTWNPSAFAPNPRDPQGWLCSFNFGAIFRTSDAGRTWHWSNENYGGTRGLGLVTNPNDPNHLLIMATDLGPIVTFDGGESFTRSNVVRFGKSDAMAGGVLPPTAGDTDTAVIYAGVGRNNLRQQGQVERSVDGGRTFSVVPDTASTQKGSMLFAPDADGDYRYIYAGNVVSTNAGQMWRDIPAGMLIAAVDPVNPARVYAWDTSSIFISEDAATSWTKVLDLDITDPLRIKGNYLKATAQSSSGGRLYLGSNNGVFVFDLATHACQFRTFEHGFVNNVDGHLTIMSVAADPNNDDTVYAGDLNLAGGVGAWAFRSLDAGESWSQMSFDGSFGVRKVRGIGVDRTSTVWVFTDNGPFRYLPS